MRTCLLRTGKGSTFPDRADVDLDLPSLAALPARPLTAGTLCYSAAAMVRSIEISPSSAAVRRLRHAISRVSH